MAGLRFIVYISNLWTMNYGVIISSLNLNAKVSEFVLREHI